VLRLFYMPRSRSSRALWALAEAGAAHELVLVERADRDSPQHRARHPLGRVPALELEDGSFVFESAAICLALADLHPDANLIPPLGTSERARAYQWVLFAVAELEGPLYRWIRESTDETAHERFAQAATAIEGELGRRGDWLLGERFSVADLMCASVLGAAQSRGLLAPWPGLEAYLARAEARPAFVAAAAISNPPAG
jgi:glutathione S-transferase